MCWPSSDVLTRVANLQSPKRWARSACSANNDPFCPDTCGSTNYNHYFAGNSGPLMKLKDIAARIGAGLEPADADAEISGVAPIESAAPGTITFIANPKYAAAARATQASAIIVDESFPSGGTPLLRTHVRRSCSSMRPLMRRAFIPQRSLIPQPKLAPALLLVRTL